jgi:antirestriction protein ArdC
MSRPVRKTTAPTQTVYERITARILDLLETGTVPWHQPWSSAATLPRNLFSQRDYHGINVWLLGSMGYSSPFWATFKQVAEAGGNVRKGEHGTPVVFWKVYDKPRQDTTGNDDVDKRFVLRAYYVFNAAQVEGIAVPVLETIIHPFTPLEVCEKLVGNMPQRPAITHGSTQAFYRPSTDEVRMPNPTLFANCCEYYSTLFHELTHSTGHASRLNRATLKDMVKFGDVSYAREELVAEMGAAYLCGVCEIDNHTVTNSAAYLAGWKKALRNDPTCLIIAASQAEKAANFIRNYYPEEGGRHATTEDETHD